MSKLSLRIDKHLEGQESRPPKVYANIYTLGEGAKRASGTPARQELIPLSDRKEHFTLLDLEPGHYYVETVLPSGEILAADVLLEEGKTRELVLRGEYSPREWLSWQHLVGNVSSRHVVERRMEKSLTAGRSAALAKKTRLVKSVKGGSAKRAGGASKKGGSKQSAPGLKASPTIRFRKNVIVEAPVSRGGGRGPVLSQQPEVSLSPSVWLSSPHPLLVGGVGSGRGVWNWLAGLEGTRPTELIKEINNGRSPLPISPYSRDAAHAVFRVSWAKTQSGGKSFAGLVPPTSRHYVAVPRRDSVELLSLPMPWKVPTTNREADIEIVVQEPTEPSGFCASAIARDEELGMLLAYLSSGALPTARKMAETAKGMLYYKVQNPFAAAAGGYALVGTATEASDREWHNWVRNLMNLFEHIPDGALQWGQLRMRMRRSQSDMDEARNAFKLAYRRGLPFYSMGMRWLLDGLELISRDDQEAAQMLKIVRQIAWRTNYQQPFTILRLGGEQRV